MAAKAARYSQGTRVLPFTLILSILFGTVIGYLLCTVFSSMSIFGRVIYHFPIVEMFIYFILMFVVQTLFSRLTIKQIKKQSLVEQVKEL